MKHKFIFVHHDNGGKKQVFTITAKDKKEAIEKGFAKARKAAKGDCIAWDCKLSF